MVSKTCEYAIRALLYIAQQSKKNRKTGVKQIALAIDSPEPFIAKILQELRQKGLVLSGKGPTGGFYLEANNMKKSIADVIYAIDGDKLFTGCGLGLSSCQAKKPCPIHDNYVTVRKQIKEMMQNAIIGDYHTSLDLGEQFLKR